MKNEFISTVFGQPSKFKVGKSLYDIEPFLELFEGQSVERWVSHLDEIMLLLVEVNALGGSLDGDLQYNLYIDVRRLRDAFRDSLLKTDSHGR